MKPTNQYNKIFSFLIFYTALVVLGCSDQDLDPNVAPDSSNARGATQIRGIGFFDANDPCDSPGQGATYAVILTGDLEGCLYITVEESECSPSGTYREVGTEEFVGTYNGEAGSFRTTYKFEAKYEGCADDGSYIGAEILGRCQHPIVEGSGEGVFEGVSGRLDMKDDIAAGNYPYRGHFRF